MHQLAGCLWRHGRPSCHIWTIYIQHNAFFRTWHDPPICAMSLCPSAVRHVCQNRRSLMEETYTYEKRPTREQTDPHKWKGTYTYMKRNLHICQTRRTLMQRDLHTWKETYGNEKRHTHAKKDLWIQVWKENWICVKRPARMSNVTNPHAKRYIQKTYSIATPHISHETNTYEKRPTHAMRDVYTRK